MITAIINPISGAGADPNVARRRIAMIEQAARERQVPVRIHLTERAGHAQELAREAAGSGCGCVIAWGGDGTVNEVGCGLMGSATVLGVVPAGSGNGLASALGVPMDAARAIADAFDAPVARIDVGMLGPRPFFNVAGIGFDAHVARLFNNRAKGSRGGWPYISIGIREGTRYAAHEYTLQLGQESRRSKALLIVFANGREFGLKTTIAPNARLDDGFLDAVVVEDPGSILARFWHARHLASGNPQRAPIVSISRITSAVVETDADMVYHVDGEPGMAGRRLDVSIVPQALSVRTRSL